jgi:hypothetical protein
MKKAMKQNGSPMPVFDFDDERTWFQVLLPIHEAFIQKQPYHRLEQGELEPGRYKQPAKPNNGICRYGCS